MIRSDGQDRAIFLLAPIRVVDEAPAAFPLTDKREAFPQESTLLATFDHTSNAPDN